MKNIHIIPTNKPSRLGYLTKKGKQVFNDLRLFDRVMPNILDSENQHLYITNDEEIIEGDLIIYKNGDEYFFAEYRLGYYDRYELCKKIILTTDQDLIKDHVQAIDDEFLEWFVKNPSCDEVETYSLGIKNEETGESCHYEYEIIIPKVEPKQLNSENFGLPKIGTKEFNNLASSLFGGKPKQETLEEVAERYASQFYKGKIVYHGFIEGAEWMQDRMYSEEDLISFAHFYFQEEFNSTMQNSNKSTDEILQEWFNQFKKTKQDETT